MGGFFPNTQKAEILQLILLFGFRLFDIDFSLYDNFYRFEFPKPNYVQECCIWHIDTENVSEKMK
jgi:hypothetical protein